METDRRDEEPVREFRLEGAGLLVIGGLLLATLVGSFMLGRWYERTTSPVSRQAGVLEGDPLANVLDEQQPVDADAEADFFDTVEGGEKEAEPTRQARRSSSPPRQAETATAGADSAQPAPAEKRPEYGPGPYYVQVFAGRDRRAAEGLVEKLQSEGEQVRLFSEREGSGALYKVRVGGFATEDAARDAAETLGGRGYAGSWVTRVEE
jgi:cell division septation protein DedD